MYPADRPRSSDSLSKECMRRSISGLMFACVARRQVYRDFSQLFGKANSESVILLTLMKRCHPSGPFNHAGELQIPDTEVRYVANVFSVEPHRKTARNCMLSIQNGMYLWFRSRTGAGMVL